MVSAEAEYLPASTVTLSQAEDLKRMAQLLDHLDDDDDVQSVWHNLENEEALER